MSAAAQVTAQRNWIAAGVTLLVLVCLHALYEHNYDSKNDFATTVKTVRAKTSCDGTKSTFDPSRGERYQFLGGTAALIATFVALRFVHHSKVKVALQDKKQQGSSRPPLVSRPRAQTKSPPAMYGPASPHSAVHAAPPRASAPPHSAVHAAPPRASAPPHSAVHASAPPRAF
jgi:hypothetical protein